MEKSELLKDVDEKVIKRIKMELSLNFPTINIDILNVDSVEVFLDSLIFKYYLNVDLEDELPFNRNIYKESVLKLLRKNIPEISRYIDSYKGYLGVRKVSSDAIKKCFKYSLRIFEPYERICDEDKRKILIFLFNSVKKDGLLKYFDIKIERDYFDNFKITLKSNISSTSLYYEATFEGKEHESLMGKDTSLMEIKIKNKRNDGDFGFALPDRIILKDNKEDKWFGCMSEDIVFFHQFMFSIMKYSLENILSIKYINEKGEYNWNLDWMKTILRESNFI